MLRLNRTDSNLVRRHFIRYLLMMSPAALSLTVSFAFQNVFELIASSLFWATISLPIALLVLRGRDIEMVASQERKKFELTFFDVFFFCLIALLSAIFHWELIAILFYFLLKIFSASALSKNEYVKVQFAESLLPSIFLNSLLLLLFLSSSSFFARGFILVSILLMIFTVRNDVVWIGYSRLKIYRSGELANIFQNLIFSNSSVLLSAYLIPSIVYEARILQSITMLSFQLLSPIKFELKTKFIRLGSQRVEIQLFFKTWLKILINHKFFPIFLYCLMSLFFVFESSISELIGISYLHQKLGWVSPNFVPLLAIFLVVVPPFSFALIDISNSKFSYLVALFSGLIALSISYIFDTIEYATPYFISTINIASLIIYAVVKK